MKLISDTDDNVTNLISNFDDSVDYMNLYDADRKFIDNHLQITKNVSQEIKKKQKNCQIVRNGIESTKLESPSLIFA